MLKVDIKQLIIKSMGTLLSEVKFELEKNKIYTILGANGSGKSTLIKSITGLLDKRFYSVNGTVLFEGKDILTLEKEELLKLRREKIKYVFQDAVNSFDQLKKLGYCFEKLTIDNSEIDPLLKFFFLPGSAELMKLYPYEVSGGMAQRINFVLVLLTHPQIVILDEPTSGVDMAISNLFLLKLREFAAGNSSSVLLVTHDLAFAQKISDKIAFLSNGKITDFYSPKEFFMIHNHQTLENFLNAHKQLAV